MEMQQIMAGITADLEIIRAKRGNLYTAMAEYMLGARFFNSTLGEKEAHQNGVLGGRLLTAVSVYEGGGKQMIDDLIADVEKMTTTVIARLRDVE